MSDANSGTATATVTITVTQTNNVPVANNEAYSVAEDGTLVIPVASLLAVAASADEVKAGKSEELIAQPTTVPGLMGGASGKKGEIEAVVAEHDDDYGLTCLDFSGGRFSVPRRDIATGQAVRIRKIVCGKSLFESFA